MLKNKEKDLLISLVIGDGCIYKHTNYNSYYLGIGHGASQKDYCEWKMNLLNSYNIFDNEIKLHTRITGTSKKYVQYYFKKADFCLKYIYEQCIIDGKKNVTNMLKHLKTNLGVAIWFMDDCGVEQGRGKQKDGSIKITKPSIKLCTHSFSYEENELIKKWFKQRYNIDCSVKTEVKRNRPNKPTYYYIKFNTSNTEKLYKLILKDYIHCCESMENKFRHLIYFYEK